MQRMLEEINSFEEEVNITFSSDEDLNKPNPNWQKGEQAGAELGQAQP